jgi:hypothetical protein
VPIQLKGRLIKYKPNAKLIKKTEKKTITKLSGKSAKKKGGMQAGEPVELGSSNDPLSDKYISDNENKFMKLLENAYKNNVNALTNVLDKKYINKITKTRIEELKSIVRERMTTLSGMLPKRKIVN